MQFELRIEQSTDAFEVTPCDERGAQSLGVLRFFEVRIGIKL